MTYLSAEMLLDIGFRNVGNWVAAEDGANIRRARRYKRPGERSDA